MKYNPQIHHRRSIRLKGYDYSQTGAYFITICCDERKCRFGFVENLEMVLNEFGQIAYNEWVELGERFSNFELDVFQIMPNHMHGIIVLNGAVGAGFTPTLNNINTINEQPQTGQPVMGQPETGQQANGQPQGIAPTNSTVGDIVCAYKSLVANGCLDVFKTKNKTMGKLWQRNYHEHIIRDEQSYLAISKYIINNPAKWKDDKFFSSE